MKDAWQEKFTLKFLELVGDSDIYVLEYSDGGGCGRANPAMETGGVFDDMIERGRAIKINNH